MSRGSGKRGHILRALRRCGYRCFWCSRELIALRSVSTSSILRQTDRRLTWVDGSGEERTAYIATVDHVISRGKGGGNKESNRVASCVACNHIRNDLDQGRVREKDFEGRCEERFGNPGI
jgi:HNH endonuclease